MRLYVNNMNYKIELPKLSYDLSELGSFLSEEQLTIHYQKHHQAYVNGANAIMEKLNKARQESSQLDMKSELKSLSFNLSGHILHSLFWENLAPTNKGGGDEPTGKIKKMIDEDFGSYERFKGEFTQTAMSVEGSGWAALATDSETGRLTLMQVEKHNVNLIPNTRILLVCDVFEHAYYIDYKNDRAKYIDAYFSLINWAGIDSILKM